jgi:hypothetical protein
MAVGRADERAGVRKLFLSAQWLGLATTPSLLRQRILQGRSCEKALILDTQNSQPAYDSMEKIKPQLLIRASCLRGLIVELAMKREGMRQVRSSSLTMVKLVYFTYKILPTNMLIGA